MRRQVRPEENPGMTHAAISTIRPPAVDGAFYPREAHAIDRTLDQLLSDAGADGEAGAGPGRPIRALIVPHAGWAYSGALAGRAYARLAAQHQRFRRVLLLGPCHRVWVPIMALPGTDAFETPLGRVPVDTALRDQLGDRPGMEICDEAHAQEHALEVQLPFLQRILDDFELMPLIVGGAPAETVAAVVTEALADPATLVVVSTDLSHFHAEASAHRRDADTAEVIEHLGEGLTGEEACGAAPLNGLLRAARRLGLTIERVGLATSADAGGPESRVVGYGAWVLRAPPEGARQSAP